ncbi:MAG: amidohydrolase family protein [Phycisphaerales bacterium JB040]
MRNHHASVVALGAATLYALAQPSSDSPFAPPPNGPRSSAPTAYAITGATLHAEPGEVRENATIVIDAGRIVSVGSGEAPAGYRVIDAEGLHVYPGFIDAWVQVERDNLGTDEPGRHPSDMVQADRDVLAGGGIPESLAGELRANGFAAAAIVPENGIFRGMGAVVSTAEAYEDRSQGRTGVYAGRAVDVMGFDRAPWGAGGGTDQLAGYPNSHMGMIALARQTFLDAAHWRDTGPHAMGSTLDWVRTGDRPTMWNSSDTLQSMLAGKVFEEFGFDNLIIVGAGDEYQRFDAIRSMGHAMVVPLRFPAKPDLSSVSAIEGVSLEELQAWEQAPANARRLHEAGLTVALTSSKLPDGAKFHDNLRRAVDEGGLDPDTALAMLTTTPARLLGVSGTLGTVEAGKVANLVVTDGDLFEKDTKLRSVWVDGREHVLHEPDEFPLDGEWRVSIGGNEMPIGFTFDGKKVSGWEDPAPGEEGERESDKARNVKVDGGVFSFLLDEREGEGGTYVISGALQSSGLIVGSSIDPDGNVFQYSAARVETDEGDVADEEDEGEGNGRARNARGGDEPTPVPDLPEGGFGPYAMSAAPDREAVLVTGATIWTSGPAGVIENGYLFVDDGRVIAVGAANPDGTINYRVPDSVRRIDASGMHVTPGLIDTHSHTGLFQLGVNESGQAITAECRIGDALDPRHINWYRQLAGGVTTAQLLHGSANAIGGQSQVVKVRWGAQDPEAFFFEGAMPGIKFALGENPRGVNWNSGGSRYPQTRMGVEALIRDRFTAAREYLGRGMRTESGRRDLELEAIAEILAGDRFIHCHSYRQDEILMLCNLAEEFGITIGTFQHGLEVYKVAEAVGEHAIGASIFSDWWAFKLEVYDAIAQGGPLSAEAGVVMSYNSDSDDLARRLNTEAAKAAKYSQGRLSKAEALEFVTINPAIQLQIEDRVGSLEVGKDADFVIWSGDPLSVFSRCESTWIDGREYFSTERDLAHRERINAERLRLIAKINDAPDRGEDEAAEEGEGEGDGSPGEVVDGPEPDHHHVHEAILTGGSMAPGDCGCHTPPYELKEIK